MGLTPAPVRFPNSVGPAASFLELEAERAFVWVQAAEAEGPSLEAWVLSVADGAARPVAA